MGFMMVLKKRLTHLRHLTRLVKGKSPIVVPDDLHDAYLFNEEMIVPFIS